MPLPDAQIDRALVVSAHPDDVDFGAAATVSQWTAAGIAVSYLILTDGDAGGFDPAVSRRDIPAIRREEQRAAAKVVGVDEVAFLGYPDGRLTVSLDLRRDIAREIRRVRPQRLLCQSPVRNFDRIGVSHPDHLAGGEAALCAVYPDARNPFAFRELLRDEGLEEWKVVEVWMAGHPQPDTYVDVTDSFDAKIAAIRSHVSQLPMVEDGTQSLEERIRGWLAAGARGGGLPEGRLAESFRVISTA